MWHCSRATTSHRLHQTAIMAPDAARRNLVGDVTDLEAEFVVSLALFAAREENPFRIARQHAAMAALVHFGIIGQQQSSGSNRSHGLLAQAPVHIRRSLELQSRDM